MSIGYSVLEESFSITATAGIKGKNNDDVEFPYEMNVSVSKWESGGYNYQFNPFTLTYQGNENVTSWNMVFDIPDDSEIVNCWNMTCVFKNGYLTIHSTSNNSNITPNQTVTNFGFQIVSSMENYELNTVKVNFYTPSHPNPLEQTITEGINVTVTKGSGWNEGGMFVSQFNFKITNTTAIDLTSWQLEILKPTLDSTMSNNWGCEYVEKDNSFIIVGNRDTNLIKSGESIDFGLQIKLPSQNYDLEVLNIFGKGIIIEN